jgi:hypothetical protein
VEQLAVGLHAYAVDSEERRSIPLFLALAAVLAAVALSSLLDIVKFPIQWRVWIDVPSVAGFYGLFYRIFDWMIWRSKLLHRLGFVRTPDIRGRWHGYLTSSFDEHAELMNTQAQIDQTWTRIGVRLETTSSESISTIASMTTDQTEGVKLNYEYVNQPKATATTTMHMHRGFASLSLSEGNRILQGDYYTGRGRQTYGRLYLEKNE